MTKKIHNAILITSVIAFVCCIIIIIGVSLPFFNNELKKEIMIAADYLCAGTEIEGKAYLERFNEEEHRITLIDTDGSVLYDTVDDTYKFQNHLDREEVIEALKNGEGESYRYSSTLMEKTYYYARRLSNGTVLRVSSNQITAGDVIAPMIIPLFVTFVIVIVLSAFLSSSLAKKIVKPINEIDFKKPELSESYPEIDPLLRKISRQNALIELQMEDLKRKQEEFLTITHNMSEGLILIDSSASVLSYNKSVLKLLSIKDKNLDESVLTFNDSEIFANAVSTVLGGSKCRPLLDINGKTLQIFANPVTVEDKVSGAVLLILDVTEKEQRDAMRREFTSNVSHELKTPLTSIYGISEIMMNGIVKPEDMPGFLQNIHDESGRLITLVNDIIKLSQLDENALLADREEIDLYMYADEVIHRLEHVAREKNVSLSLSGEHGSVVGIPSIISEMIYNLCDNAIKYNREGGSVFVSIDKKDGHPAITVRDTGIGIPKDHLDRVFERFYRVDKSHSKEIGGTGLGLSIVKHGAAVHNARVKLSSTVGEGTSVTVIFE